jgi:F0F1-type ATP synthase membrane subunit b/b'
MPTSTIVILAVFLIIVAVLSVAYVLLRQREQQLVRELSDAQQKMSDTGFLEQRLKEIETRALEKEQEILAQAQQEASEVVTAAHHGAEQVTTQAQEQTRQLIDQAAAQLTGWQQQMVQEQEQKLQPAYQEAAEGIADIPEQISAKTDKLMQDVQQQMLTEFEKRQQDFDAKLNTEWEQVRKEVAAYQDEAKQQVASYKQQQQQKVDKHIAELIGTTLRQTLSVALSPKDQQRIVFEALERAKEQHAFDEVTQ